MLGPRRVDVNGDGEPTGLPTGLVDNPCSILDMTDLVFIDPVGTGYSRAMKGTDPSDFWTYDADIISVSKFIRLYTSLYGRWGSPKYLSGESYGTVRAVGVADYLATQYDMYVNGAILISSINDMSTALNERDNSTDLSYVLTLPSYAAIVWYHGLLDEKYQSMSLEDYMAEVREFARGDYQYALFKGAQLSQAGLDDIAGRIAAYIGLKKEAVIRDNLRVHVDDFCAGLLSDRNLTVGCLDGRLTGPVTDGSPSEGGADPSSNTFGTAFGSAINNYFTAELGYQTNLLYVSFGHTPFSTWKYNRDNQALDQKKLIRNTMSRNRFMKVWVLCGYYDLSTPFFAAEWVYDHVFLNPENRENLSFTYYPAGHMIYMHQPSLEQFREDAEAWYNAG